jgi:hypothetical protein
LPVVSSDIVFPLYSRCFHCLVMAWKAGSGRDRLPTLAGSVAAKCGSGQALA